MAELRKRVVQWVVTILTVITLTFGMIRLLPGGPMDYIRGLLLEQAGGSMSGREISRLVESYTNINPEKPVWSQYIDYVANLMFGDWGQSFYYKEPVQNVLFPAIPWTVFIMSVALLLIFVLGVVIGSFMAYYEGGLFDTVSTISFVIFNSIPYYVAAIVLLFVFAYQYQIFPINGRMDPTTTPGLNLSFMLGVLHHGTLPILSLLVGFGGTALQMRANSIRVLGEDYLRVAQLRGISSERIAARYVGRNAVLPMYTSLLIRIGFIFGGSVILEQIFSYPGVGFYMFQGIAARDYPLMMGAFIVISIAVTTTIMIADLTYGWIDPRAGGDGSESY